MSLARSVRLPWPPYGLFSSTLLQLLNGAKNISSIGDCRAPGHDTGVHKSSR
jgi:hypothetical protein